MITDVNVSPLSYSTNGTLALASVTVDNAVVISSIAVKQNSQTGELYVQMPQKFNKTKGAYEDVAFPITSAARDELVGKVIAKYNNPSISYDIRDKVNIEPDISANIAKYQKPLENGKIGAGTLTVGDSFVIRNVNAYQSEKGQFYLMPQYKALSGEFKSIVAPASKDMHKKITDVVKTEINTDYSYRSVDNETFQKLRDTCPDLFKQCSNSDGKNVKIKFNTADKEKINEMLGNIVNAAKPNLSAAAAAVPKPAMPRM